MTFADPNLPVQSPDVPGPESFSDPVMAVERAQALYEIAVSFLSEKFADTLSTGKPANRYRAFYPEIRLTLFSGGQIARELAEFDPDCVHIATEGTIGLVEVRTAVCQTPAIFAMVMALLLIFMDFSAVNFQPGWAALLGAGLATGLSAIGSGIGGGVVAQSSSEGIARNPRTAPSANSANTSAARRTTVTRSTTPRWNSPEATTAPGPTPRAARRARKIDLPTRITMYAATMA